MCYIASWYCITLILLMNKESRKGISLQILARHQERIKTLVSKIQNYKPHFHINSSYRSSSILRLQQKQIQREKKQDQLFEQNMKLIYRIQTTGPKVNSKKFPGVKINPRRLKTLSINGSKSTSKTKFQVKDSFRNEQELFNENIKLITSIESTGPKISCWISKKTRNLNQLKRIKKREQQLQILKKFNQISKEIKKIRDRKSIKNSSSISSLNKSIV